MSEPKPQFLNIGNNAINRNIAYLRSQNQGQGLLWLPGFYSSMESEKASVIADWSEVQGFALTRFDYFAHGKSDGRREDGTISIWLEDAERVLETLTNGPQIVIGSSMGGWISLLLLRKLIEKLGDDQDKISAIVLIAPAWDMTHKLILKRLDEDAQRQIDETGVFYAPSQYDDVPYPITRSLIEDGARHLIEKSPFQPNVPIRILHGMEDPDVPWQNSVELLGLLGTGDATLTLIKDGDHRLSRKQDIERLKYGINSLCLSS